MANASTTGSGDNNINSNSNPSKKSTEDGLLISFSFTTCSLDRLAKLLEKATLDFHSPDESSLIKIITSVRKMLSGSEGKDNIRKVIEAGFLPLMVQSISDMDKSSKIHMEAAWALTNVASGSAKETEQAIAAGAVPALVNLVVSSQSLEVKEQALWALGNISGDGPERRNLILSYNIVIHLKTIIKANEDKELPVTLTRTMAWLVSNLCRSKEATPPQHAVKQMLPLLSHFLGSEDQETAKETLWALSYVANEMQYINLVIENGFIPKLISFIRITDEPSTTSLLTPALRTLGNLITGNDSQTQAVLDAGLLLNFDDLLAHDNDHISREALWILSNVTVGTDEQVKSVPTDLYPLILLQLDQGSFGTKKEAAWVIHNLLTLRTRNQKCIKAMVEHDVIPFLCQTLTNSNDDQMRSLMLDSILGLFSFSEEIEDHTEAMTYLDFLINRFEQCEGLGRVISFTDHESVSLVRTAQKIRNYF